MEWLDRMNSAMDYIEQHLAEEISYDKLADLGSLSNRMEERS